MEGMGDPVTTVVMPTSSPALRSAEPLSHSSATLHPKPDWDRSRYPPGPNPLTLSASRRRPRRRTGARLEVACRLPLPASWDQGPPALLATYYHPDSDTLFHPATVSTLSSLVQLTCPQPPPFLVSPRTRLSPFRSHRARLSTSQPP